MSNEIELSFLDPADLMSKTNYDPNGDNVVISADKIISVDSAGNGTYYGKNDSGVVGFHAITATGGATTLNELTDVNTTGVVSGDVLSYNGFGYIPQSFSELASTNFTLSGAVNGEVLTYNSGTGKFEPAPVSAGSTTLSALSDTSITSPSNGHVLTYSGGTWINQAASTPSLALADLTDVTGTTTSGHVLTYNGTSYSFQAVPAGGATTLNELSDVNTSGVSSGSILEYNGSNFVVANYDLNKLSLLNVSGASAGQVLAWNSGTGQFVPSDPATGGATTLGELTDVNATATSGQVLTYNGASFVFQTPSTGGGGATNLSELTDVDTTGVTDGQFLAYNSTNSQFEPVAPPSGGGSVTGASIERVRIQFDAVNMAAGTVGASNAYTSTDGVTPTLKVNESSSNIITTFTFTGYQYPPANIMYYGYDAVNQRYNLRIIGNEPLNIALSSSGDRANPDTFGSFSEMEMLTTTFSMGGSAAGFTPPNIPAEPAHGYIVFVMQG